MATETTMMIVEVIRSIPYGRVISYGKVAELAGCPRSGADARRVARVLHSMSKNYSLPWWRVVKRDGSIGLREASDLQRKLLEEEGVEFLPSGAVDLDQFGIGADFGNFSPAGADDWADHLGGFRS
ncbi:MAG: MGMT family protein [Spirochaetales bacterium]|nr:MGMT family protein [Spirochaetales bacterium]